MGNSLSQGQAKNIEQSLSGVAYVGNAPVLEGKSSGTLGTAGDTAFTAVPLAGFLQGVVAKVTTAVTGGDSTLTVKVGADSVGTLVIPKDTPVGAQIVWTPDTLPFVEAGTVITVSHDAVATAGAAWLTQVFEPV